MYAIIVSGGKQHKVEKDAVIRVEKLDVEVGAKVKFDVLLIADGDNLTVGTPVVEGASVEAEVLAQGKGAKIDIFKYKAKKNERRRQGHRQPYTEVKILEIKG